MIIISKNYLQIHKEINTISNYFDSSIIYKENHKKDNFIKFGILQYRINFCKYFLIKLNLNYKKYNYQQFKRMIYNFNYIIYKYLKQSPNIIHFNIKANKILIVILIKNYIKSNFNKIYTINNFENNFYIFILLYQNIHSINNLIHIDSLLIYNPLILKILKCSSYN